MATLQVVASPNTDSPFPKQHWPKGVGIRAATMTMRCLCSICTCGKHRCNVKNTCICKGTDEPVRRTEYMDQYVEYGWSKPRDPFKHKQAMEVPGGPMDGVTTYRSKFVPHQLQARVVRDPLMYKPPVTKVDGLSTYRYDYPRWPVQPMPPAVRFTGQLQLSGEKMGTLTTYKDHFRRWPIKKNESTKVERHYVPPSSKFGNLTTYQNDFISKCVVPQKSFRPVPATQIFNGKFDGQTVYQLTYVPKVFEPWPRREPATYKPSTTPLDGLTVYRRDYTGRAGKPVKSIRPIPQIADTDAHFEGISEMQDKFQRWPIPKREVRPTRKYKPPTDTMDLNSTYRMNFPYKTQPVAPSMPKFPTIEIGKGPFKGQSTYKQDFCQWPFSRRDKLQRFQEFQPPKGKMENLTTVRQHFVAHPLAKTQSLKPPNVVVQSKIPFDGTTTYTNEFTTKQKDICPAMYSVPPGYVYHSEDPRGHRMYRLISNRAAANHQLPSDVTRDKCKVSFTDT
uniref:stabilizer of axonemal microtubules 2-like n=1 Tax=Myxine glutinosa TaxID=7769 RepID=UPI00358F19D2